MSLALSRGTRCFYTTPIKALSNQKYHDLVAVLCQHLFDPLRILQRRSTDVDAACAGSQLEAADVEVPLLGNARDGAVLAGQRGGLDREVLDEEWPEIEMYPSLNEALQRKSL